MIVSSLIPNTLEAEGALEFKAIFAYVVSFQASQVYAVRPCIKKRRKHWVQTSWGVSASKDDCHRNSEFNSWDPCDARELSSPSHPLTLRTTQNNKWMEKKIALFKWGNLYIELIYFTLKEQHASYLRNKIDGNINGHANVEGEKLNSWSHTLDRELQAT